MKSNKVLIAVLVVIAVLFAAGLGTNLIPKKNEQGGAAGFDAKTSWVGGLDTVMGRFAPGLDLERLGPVKGPLGMGGPSTLKCWTKQDRRFEVTAKDDCIVAIKRQSDAEYQRASLRVPPDVVILVAKADPDQACPGAREAVTRSPKSQRMRVVEDRRRPVRLTGARPSGKTTSPPAQAQPRTIKVSYQPKGEDAPGSPVCAADNPLSLILLAAGGTLTLSCEGCDEQAIAMTLE